MKLETGMLLWANLAYFFFGLTNFLIGYSNQLTTEINNWAVIGILWFVSGVVGLVSAIYFYAKKGKLFFADTAGSELLAASGAVPPISCFLKFVTICGGLFSGLAQLMMKLSFAVAPQESGPLCAVLCSDVIIVSMYCHFVHKELMDSQQMWGVVAVVTGQVIIAMSSTAPSPTTSDSQPDQPMLAYVLAVLGMLSFAACVLAIRSGAIGGLAAWSNFDVRMLVMLVGGAVAFAYSCVTVGWPAMSLAAWMCPVIAGLAQAVGVFCLNKALQFPSTGVAIAIIASNSVMVLILNVFVCGLIPNTPSLVGMGIVVVAVAWMSVSNEIKDTDVHEAEIPASSTPEPSYTALKGHP